ncbi:HD domain-containing protein [Paraburkholderia strydomiana]|uniref:HD domain-containing protein n=1 Tax=Paraburkholderia strydomiana TaxID=1245417 RepID=UPI001BE8F248|nr:HD domain-containing protein [Paraburkholderia strydomiana]MBT2790072.1 HD domain-containing protein [Paraburkholderia strydomiana]
MSKCVAGITIPSGPMSRAAAKFAIANMPDVLYRHSVRVFLFAALIGQRRRVAYDADLLYVTALFHDVGLTPPYQSSQRRFEVDSANAVKSFLSEHDALDTEIAEAWRATALHTTFGIETEMLTLASLIITGVETDLLGLHFDEVDHSERNSVLRAFPRGPAFKETIIEVFARGMKHRPATTFGTVNADVLDRCDPNYRRKNFCGLILGSSWAD